MMTTPRVLSVRPLCSALLLIALLAAPTHAGYEQPVYIDGCQSADGRFVITARAVEVGRTVHGPHKWEFTWKDTKTGQTATFPAQGVGAGQVYAQLFIAPDGETFALWNHVTLWTAGKSEMHGPKDLPYHEDTDAWRRREEFTRRLIVYRKDGSIIKSLGVGDFLLPAEWESVGRQFNRVDWIEPYDKLNYKATPRMQYAFYRVSPDYTVLEFRPVQPRSRRNDPPRVVRVSLTDGRVLDSAAAIEDKAKIPVRPFQGDDHLPHMSPLWKESYTPSLDPVRAAGAFRIVAAAEAHPAEKAPKQPAFPFGEAKLIRDGFKKADTPTWLPNATGGKSAAGVALTDLEQRKLFLVTPPDKLSELRGDLGRGKVGPDKKFYGIRLLPRPADAAPAKEDADAGLPVLVSWQPGGEPVTLIDKAAGDRELSLNDLAISSRGLIYFTTLKDPDKGRLSVVDPRTKTVRVLFDGEQEPTLSNPNGVALCPDERILYVGISNYKDRKHSGIYAFAIQPDGTIDVAAGKMKPWAAVQGPDGVAVDRQGNVYFTAGGGVEVFDRYSRRWGKVRIPKGSGTNLCLGGENESVLYITTSNALFAAQRN